MAGDDKNPLEALIRCVTVLDYEKDRQWPPSEGDGMAGDAKNPLDEVDLASPEAVDVARRVAEAVVQLPDDGELDCSPAAVNLVWALILCVKVLDYEEDR